MSKGAALNGATSARKGTTRRNAASASPSDESLPASEHPVRTLVSAPSTASADQIVSDVGSRVRTLRNRRGWTLTDAAARLGIGRSTLAKLEVGQMSPTLGLLHKIAVGLEVDVGALVAEPPRNRPSGRRVFTRSGSGEKVELDGYCHEKLCSGLEPKQMIPFFTTLKPLSDNAIPPWFRHVGEEFVLVMKGKVAFYSEYYAPTILDVGDSVYLDAQMGHCFVAQDDEEAVVLFVATQQFTE